MRGRGRHPKTRLSSRRGSRAPQGPPTDEREALERRWFTRIERQPGLAALVTGAQLADEPLHRWLPFKQGYAPELVRRFLTETGLKAPSRGPLLDPFSGCGTFAVECARQGVPARGAEALASLVFVAEAKTADAFDPLPDLSASSSWEEAAERLTDPVHQAALICAVARQHTSEGRLNKNAPALDKTLGEVAELMSEDLQCPLTVKPQFEQGDARRLEALEAGSIGGMLTSPPYLSRYDYTKATRPHEMVYRYWYAGRDLSTRRDDQVRAHPRAYRQQWEQAVPPAVEEACAALIAVDEQKLAGVVRSYFEDLFAAVSGFARVLAAGAPCWMVVGGARLKDVYVPSDVILAEFAQEQRFEVLELREARRLTPTGRNLGGLTNVAPRESIIILRRT